ncbi:MAG: glucoamylase family protein [Duganella sp.]
MTTTPPIVRPPVAIDADTLALLTALQRESFDYFVTEAHPVTGLVRDKTAGADWPASIAATGMALTCYPIGVERGFMSRDDAIHRTLTTLRFLANSEQSESPTATGYKGFYYHFIDMATGARAHQCELSSIDTALLIAGVLTAAQYFAQDCGPEQEIRALADLLYRRVDWQWMRHRKRLLCHGWKPGKGFLRWHWEGYDEALILYVLALGSPTHPIERDSYDAWASTYEWKNIYGIEYLYAGPLFIHQMSHVWLDTRGIRDDYMRARGLDYFENSRRATLVQQRYAIENPLGFPGYDALHWGISACDGPGPATRKIGGVQRKFYDYMARAVPYGPDDGTLAPWAAVASLPFAPEIVLPTIRQQQGLLLNEARQCGYRPSYSTLFHQRGGGQLWVSPYHFGIDKGPAIIMVDNYLHDATWALMRSNRYVRAGLQRAGFTGGWLDGCADQDFQQLSTQTR